MYDVAADEVDGRPRGSNVRRKAEGSAVTKRYVGDEMIAGAQLWSF